MNRHIFFNIFVLALTVLLPISVPAADLPVLPKDGNIKTGTLPNGVSYYVVQNASYKGLADIALVQKAGTDDETEALRGSAFVQARGSLADLPHFSHNSPFSYLKGKAILPSESGYVKVSKDATIYRFENLIQARKSDIVDSTLLLVFDIISREEGKMKEMYSPSNQAIIVSGDIDPDAIKGKMDILSMFITKRPAIARKTAYQWEEKPQKTVVVSSAESASVSVKYSSPRTGIEDMGTVLPLVSSRYAASMEILFKRRLSSALRAKSIPYSGIDYEYLSSADSPEDESITVTVHCSDDQLEAVAGLLAATLSELDSAGISKEEFSAINNELMIGLTDSYGKVVIDNARYVEKCISAFLYGSSLASDKSNLAFFSDRNMEDENAVRLFNNFVSALIDKSSNLVLSCTSTDSSIEADAIKSSFNNAWSAGNRVPYHPSIADTTLLRIPNAKTKLRQITPEPLFGGEMWTFANGIKVIFKETGDNGYFSYSWLIKCGYSNMQDLKSGESAYLKDLFSTYKVAGMSGQNFNNMLLANGVTMDTEVSLSEVNISGIAQSNKLQLLMKALYALVDSREKDEEAYDYFRNCESLSVARADEMLPKLDSIMNRNAKLSKYKRDVQLADDFADRADRFFGDVLSRTNDGVLIIVGDLDKENVKKMLSQYLGSFKTEKAYSYRSTETNGTVTARTTQYATASQPKIGIKLKANINYTAENFIAANIAALAVEEAVSAAIATQGWTLQGQSEVRMFPDESLIVDLVMFKAEPKGLPASMVSEDSADEVLSTARKAIGHICSKGISEDYLKVGKAVLQNYFSSWKNDQETITKILVLRYSYGKDIISDYNNRIASISVRSVNPILSSLADSGIAEYVVRKDRIVDFLPEEPLKEAEPPVIPEIRPAPGSLYYPYDGSKVSFENIELSSLTDLPEVFMESDFPTDTLGRTLTPERMERETIKQIDEALIKEEEGLEEQLQSVFDSTVEMAVTEMTIEKMAIKEKPVGNDDEALVGDEADSEDATEDVADNEERIEEEAL